MKPPEEVKVEFVRQWVKKAEGDFNTAEHLSKSGESYVYAAAFHAQQAAEKATKACLYSAGQRYPNGLPGGTPFETYSARDLEQAVTDMEAIFAAAERFLRGRGILE